MDTNATFLKITHTAPAYSETFKGQFSRDRNWSCHIHLPWDRIISGWGYIHFWMFWMSYMSTSLRFLIHPQVKTVIEVHLPQAAHLIDLRMKMKSLARSLTTQKASTQTHWATLLSILQNSCVNVATATSFYYWETNWMSFESEGSWHCRIKNPLMLSSRMAFLTRQPLIGPVWVGEECQAGWVRVLSSLEAWANTPCQSLGYFS